MPGKPMDKLLQAKKHLSVQAILRRLEGRIPDAMLRDRPGLNASLQSLREQVDRGNKARDLFARTRALERHLQKSLLEVRDRKAGLPHVSFPEDLPIASRAEEIIRALQAHQVVIISGETGSGKSTQIPKMCLKAGRGAYGKVGCTQPRRIAAVTIAHRLAEELGEDIGKTVGYRIRFADTTRPESSIQVMTDGILLTEIQKDPLVLDYDTIILDEAHERSLNIDLLLGILRTLLPKRPEFKLVITSATLDTEKFSTAFGQAPVIEVSGRMYPVEVVYRPLESDGESTADVPYVEGAVRAVEWLRQHKSPGDILVFMPTEQDILESCQQLEGRRFPGVTILPLFARLPRSQQLRVYRVTGPKIVIATNVAETSLTIPGIRYVIDTGLARITRYLPRTRITALPVSPISRSSADQRKGRCGRVREGFCIRLYSEEDYGARPLFTPPEILRSNLAEVILRMAALQLGDIAAFPFVDPPHPNSIKDGFDVLLELGAIAREGDQVSLSHHGKIMARMPLDPRISRMLLQARKEECVAEMTVLAAALSIQDPRERPPDAANRADQVHGAFKDPDSDFITLLNIWNPFQRHRTTGPSQGQMRRYCKEHFLSFLRMREWTLIHDQILTILKEERFFRSSKPLKEPSRSLYDRIHRSILTGFLSNVAMKKEKNLVLSARGREAMVFPGSTLFNKTPPWMVAAEMVQTSRLFARTAARIQSEWLEELGGSLCRSTFSQPHWVKSRGEVRAQEQVRLFGLPIARRSVSYGPVNPEESRTIFVQAGLVEGEMPEPFPFQQFNHALVARLRTMEEKLRQRGLLIQEEDMARFYSERLPGVYDVRTLRKRIQDQGGEQFLHMKEEDLLTALPDQEVLSRYPDRITIGDLCLPCQYRFAPGEPDDGVTVTVPAHMVAALSLDRLEWDIPGLLEEKIAFLIRGLPKNYRKQLLPLAETIETVQQEMERGRESLHRALSRFLLKRYRVNIPTDVWGSIEMPTYQKMRFSLVNQEGRELLCGRDIPSMQEAPVPPLSSLEPGLWKEARAAWEKTGLTTWDLPSLPEMVFLKPGLPAFPGLEPENQTVNLRLFDSPARALECHRQGVLTLFTLHFAKELRFLKKELTLSRDTAPLAAYFMGTRRLEETLYQTLLKRHFWIDIRSREAFLEHADLVGPQLAKEGLQLLAHTENVLRAYHDLRLALQTLEKANPSNPPVLNLCREIQNSAGELTPRDFPAVYPMERLSQLPRYLRGLQVRAERGAPDPARDQTKQQQVAVGLRMLERLREEMGTAPGPEKVKAVEDFRWMVEEFRVSCFAPELKTPFPVSKKRLEARFREIQKIP